MLKPAVLSVRLINVRATDLGVCAYQLIHKRPDNACGRAPTPGAVDVVLFDSGDLELLRLLEAAPDKPCRAGLARHVELAAANALAVLDGAPISRELGFHRQPRSLFRRKQLTSLY